MSRPRPDWIEKGSRLREAREAAKITQEELGVKSGIDRQTISKMENGRGGITLDKAKRLAPHLSIDPRDLIDVASPSMLAALQRVVRMLEAAHPEAVVVVDAAAEAADLARAVGEEERRQQRGGPEAPAGEGA